MIDESKILASLAHDGTVLDRPATDGLVTKRQEMNGRVTVMPGLSIVGNKLVFHAHVLLARARQLF